VTTVMGKAYQMKSDYDVAIVGAGPAGAMAAMTLAQSGLRTILIEKHELPRKKVCAGGLVKRAASILPEDMDYPVESVCNILEFRVHGTEVSAKTQYDSLAQTVNRSQFDNALVKYAILKGALLKQKCVVKELITQPVHVDLVVESGDTLSASYVVVAEGANARLSESIFGKQPCLVPAIEADVYARSEVLSKYKDKMVFDLDVIEGGYGWVFYKGDHLSVGLGVVNGEKKNLQQSFSEYVLSLGFNQEDKICNKKGALIPVRKREGPYMKGRIMLVGDAAGFADPISAEGLSYALISGRSAAESIIEYFDSPENVSRGYIDKIQINILDELNAAERLVGLVYRFKSIRNLLFRLRGERLANGVAKILSGERRMADITSISKFIKIIFKRK